jgi:hypothetical protein
MRGNKPRNGKGDYAIKAGSPCLAIGFKNFPMDSFGTVASGISDAVRRARSQDHAESRLFLVE